MQMLIWDNHRLSADEKTLQDYLHLTNPFKIKPDFLLHWYDERFGEFKKWSSSVVQFGFILWFGVICKWPFSAQWVRDLCMHVEQVYRATGQKLALLCVMRREDSKKGQHTPSVGWILELQSCSSHTQLAQIQFSFYVVMHKTSRWSLLSLSEFPLLITHRRGNFSEGVYM